MAEEFELKFRLAAHEARRLSRLPLLQQAKERRRRLLVSIYYDTFDLQLRQAGIALRLRRLEGRWLRTVKCQGHAIGGLSRRPEWERPHDGRFDFSDLDDEPSRTLLSALAEAGLLQPIFTTRLWRTSWLVESSPGDRVEIVFDHGEISAADRRAEISEIEIEQAGGREEALFTCARALAERIALFPEPESKAERGYRLFANETARPVKAIRLRLSPRMSARAAANAILFACYGQLVANRTGAVVGDDPEYIHQLRVAARRFRVALRFFAPALPAGVGDALQTTMKDVMAHLAPARELDVFAEWLAERQACGTEALIAHVVRMRDEAREETRRFLESRRFAGELIEVLAHLAALACRAAGSSSLPAAPGFTQNEEAGRVALSSFARRRLKKLCETLKVRAEKALSGKPRRLHQLRIAIKRLRYALEYCIPEGRESAWAGRLAKWQERLGRLNDLFQFEAKIIAMARDDPSLASAAESLLPQLHEETAQLVERVLADDYKALRRLSASQLMA